jgi:Bacterial membrane protein YfhO
MKQRAAAVFASLAFTWLFFAEYLSPFRKVHIPFDLEGYHYPLVDYAFQSLRAGHFPQWDWSIYSGISFVGNIQAALFYPPTWLLFLANAGREHVTYQSLQAFVVAHVWLAAVFCFLWLRSRGLSTFACVAAAQMLAFSGYICLQLQHQGLVTAFAWYPLGAWGIDDAAEKRSPWPLWKLALASATCFLTGYPPMWIVFSVAMFAYALGRLNLRLAVGTAVALAASMLLAMVQLLPALEAQGYMFPDARYGGGIRDPLFYVSYLIPNFFDFGINTPVWTNPGKEYLYLGAPGLAGILLVFAYRRFRAALPALFALAASLIFLTNPFNLVWASIRNSTLLSEVFRDWYFLAGVAFAVVPLAAIGLDAVRPKWPKLQSVALILIAAWSTWELYHWFHQDFAPGWSAAPLITLAIFVTGLFSLRADSRVLFAALILLVGVDYKAFGTSKRFNAIPGPGSSFHSDHFDNLDTTAFREMRAHPEYRILFDQTAPFPSIVHHWAVRTPQGFDPFLTVQYREMLGAAATFRSDRLFDVDPKNDEMMHLLGVRYVITGDSGTYYAAMANNPKFRLLGSVDPYYKTFEYLDATPSFAATGSLDLLKWTPEQRSFRVHSTGGRLTLSEQLLPGWTATVDSQAAPIERWHGAFQSVNVSPGEHMVEFRFSSPGLVTGAIVSLVSLVVLIAVKLRLCE